MTYGVDYPWSKPAPSALRDAGVTFALRYLSKDPSKNLTLTEANALAAAGIWSGVVWETTAGRALDGRAAGTADAREALRQATACGMPSSRPIYFAVDTDTTWSQVQPYFHGIRDVLPAERIGVYGGIRIIAGAADSGLVAWYWQTLAWSGGKWDPRAHIRQTGYVTVGKVQCDRNQAMADDFGQWMPGRTPTIEEDIVTPQDIEAIAKAVWEHQVPIPRPQGDGSIKYDGTQAAYWPLVWGNVWVPQILAAIKAAELTPAEVQQALADGTLTVKLVVAPNA